MRVVGEIHGIGGDGCRKVAERDQVRGIDDPGVGRHSPPLKRGASIECALRAVAGQDPGDVGSVGAGSRGTDGGDFVDIGMRAVDPAVVDAGDDAIAGEARVGDGPGGGNDRGILDRVNVDRRAGCAVLIELRCGGRTDPFDFVVACQVDQL